MKVSVNYISASGMRFETADRIAHSERNSETADRMAHSAKRRRGSSIFCILFLSLASLLISPLSPLIHAGISDRVVAYVDNIAITLSDLERRYGDTIKVNPDITKEEVLTTMINRTLMLREARKMRLEAQSEDQLLKEYIDLKVKAFIRIKDEEIKEFYDKHVADFRGKEFEAVRDEIENYLTENELNLRLKTHISELREKACVQSQLK